MIAGFPGETENEFLETLDFLQTARLSRLHVFPYSRRTGTVADRLPGQVPENIKKQRAERLIEVSEALEREYCRESVGCVRPVLFETTAGGGYSRGHTDTYVRVRAKANPGEIRNVLITGADGTLCTGVIKD